MQTQVKSLGETERGTAKSVFGTEVGGQSAKSHHHRRLTPSELRIVNAIHLYTIH
jgi:hypothetical protein